MISKVQDSETSEMWDAIDTETLLSLTNYRKTTTEFGYVFRHYWVPDTELAYQVTMSQSGPCQVGLPSERLIRMCPAQFDADHCLWREIVVRPDDNAFSRIACHPPRKSESLCLYNRSEQSFRTSEILGFDRWPDDLTEARKQAFLQIPLIAPLLPIPLGFQWHVRDEDSYLDFTLETKLSCGLMPVLIIRRRGEIRLSQYYQGAVSVQQPVLIQRQGITAYALNRSVILEDRTRDVFHSLADPSEIDGLVIHTTKKLVRSEWRSLS